MKKSLFKAYGIDASQFTGSPGAVVFPRNVDEVSRMVREARSIVPRGGGSGRVGGCVPARDGSDTVLDVSKLTSIGEVNGARKEVVVEAGVILDDLNLFLEDTGLWFPIDPTSSSMCTLGGMIATNAVGRRGMKYGTMTNWVKWIEVVDGKGSISRKGMTEVSDYIGLEGITGVIVRACLKLSPRVIRSASIVRSLHFSDIAISAKELKRDESVSMIELLSPFVSRLIGFDEQYHLFVEFEHILGKISGEEYISLLTSLDGVFPALAKEGYTRVEDPHVMLDKIPQLVEWLEARRIPYFGHLGDGLIYPCFLPEQEEQIPELLKIVSRLSGQISGSFGIGILKRAFVPSMDKKILANIRKRTDPQGKFNRGKLV